MTCDTHEWTVENVKLGQWVVALVVCLKCNTIKKPLGADGPKSFVTEGSLAEAARETQGGPKP